MQQLQALAEQLEAARRSAAELEQKVADGLLHGGSRCVGGWVGVNARVACTHAPLPAHGVAWYPWAGAFDAAGIAPHSMCIRAHTMHWTPLFSIACMSLSPAGMHMHVRPASMHRHDGTSTPSRLKTAAGLLPLPQPGSAGRSPRHSLDLGGPAPLAMSSLVSVAVAASVMREEGGGEGPAWLGKRVQAAQTLSLFAISCVLSVVRRNSMPEPLRRWLSLSAFKQSHRPTHGYVCR